MTVNCSACVLALALLVAPGVACAQSARAEQSPKPYFAPKERERRLELLDLGPDVGLALRPAKGDGISYSAGPLFGAHARIELLRWLGFRAVVSRSTHGVSVPGGALLAGTDAEQPSLSVLQFGARLEPTWRLTERARLWCGVGISWDRIWADKPTLHGRAVQGADRTGVALETSAALGATWDAIPRWLALSAGISGALVTSQSGDMFERQQGVDENVSRPADPLVYIAPLPEFGFSYIATLGVGILL